MKSSIVLLATLSLLAFAAPGTHADTPAPAKCYYSGEPAQPGLTVEYEGVVYGFSSETNRKKFGEERAASLYQRIGGKAALNAAVDLFYVKILADEKVNHFFDDVNMNVQIRKQKEFLAHAFGAPVAWNGKDMRKAHVNLDLREDDFAAIAGHLQASLVELKLDEAVVGEIMAIAGSVKDDVLNR